jgi:hypothetical protein
MTKAIDLGANAHPGLQDVIVIVGRITKPVQPLTALLIRLNDLQT